MSLHHWIVQEGLFHEDGLAQLREALIRGNVDHTFVKVVPFSHALEPEPTSEKSMAFVMVMGAYTMLEIAKARGWSTHTTNLDFRSQVAHWGDWMFNADAVIAPLGKVSWDHGYRFVRPVDDGKAFAGHVCTPSEWAILAGAVQSGLIAGGNGISQSTTKDTLVQVCGPKAIASEYRFWIVDGEIVTACGYKRAGHVYANGFHPIDGHITAFVRNVLKRWMPNRAFCLDVFVSADTGEPKVGEVNCIHAAGLYGANVSRLVQFLDRTPITPDVGPALPPGTRSTR